MARVVETVTATTMAELRERRDGAIGDLVELRIDGVRDLDVRGALAQRSKPVIVTCRPTWEGGRFDGSESTRLQILSDAIRLGAEYVDLEFAADRAKVRSGLRTKTVLSVHDFAGIPADLADRVAAMRREGPSVVKVAIHANRLSDCLTLRDLIRGEGDVVAIALGSAGHVTRLCPWLFDSIWTYGGTAASGQMPVRDLIDVYRVARGTSQTAVYGVTGAPLGHSASPAMHNAAFAAAGMDAVFVPLETPDARELLDVAESLGVRGVSVTAPLKTSFAPFGVRYDDISSRIGAINTLRRQDGGWEGRNFDPTGFIAPLRRREYSLAGKKATVLGAGGAARAVVWALIEAGAEVAVSARRGDRAAKLAGDLGATPMAWPPPERWDLLVNATPVGTSPNGHETPLAIGDGRGRIVYDLVYNPRRTALLQAARAAGAETIDGLEMLVAQACAQFEWWTGIPAPADVIAAHANAFVERGQAAA